jgi:prepilin-type N-terminal cleavage/methylation domain-containing protein
MKPYSTQGFSLLELLVILAVIGILAGVAALSLNRLENPLNTASSTTAGLLKQARAKAMATTSGYRVKPDDNQKLNVQSAINCSVTTSTDWTDEPSLTLELPKEVTINTGWSTCFNSRGLSTNAQTLTLTHTDGRTQTLDIFVGGAVQENP